MVLNVGVGKGGLSEFVSKMDVMKYPHNKKWGHKVPTFYLLLIGMRNARLP